MSLFEDPSTDAPEGPTAGTPLAERMRPRTFDEFVGQQDIQNRGENGNLGWIGDCAYVGAYYGGTDPLMGMAVVAVPVTRVG